MIMMNDLVSIVIPVYNAGERIKPCIESIIRQDYDNLEIILVDDVSQDNTINIAREILSSSKRRFRIITHQRNRGECAARNTGLEAAKGNYVLFMDDDDMAEHNFISELHRLISENDCDVSFCGMSERYSDGRLKAKTPINLEAPFVRDGEEIMYLRLTKAFTPPHMCAMMMSRKFLDENKLRYFDGSCPSGDMEFQFKILCHAERIAFTNECLYIYVHHPEMVSLSGKRTPEKKLAYFESVSEAAYRYSQYIFKNPPSERVKIFAARILMPQSLIRKLICYALKNDKAGYNFLLKDDDTNKILRKALGFFTLINKPEVFLKALAVSFVPDIYFKIRRLLGT